MNRYTALQKIDVLTSLFAKGLRAITARPQANELFEKNEFPLDWRIRMGAPRADGAVWAEDARAQMTYRHPVATAFLVIGSSQSYRRTIDQYERIRLRAQIKNAIQALLSMQEGDGSFRYPIAVPRYGLSPGWSSSMAQGLFISACREANRLEILENDLFLARATMAADHMRTSVGEGGCTYYDSGWTSLEECPAAIPSRILNGAIFSLIGLFDSPRDDDHRFALEVAKDLSRHLGAWDLGWWSSYDGQDASPASGDYHALHVELLTAMELLVPDHGFEIAAGKFVSYESNPIYRVRALTSLGSRRFVDVARGKR